MKIVKAAEEHEWKVDFDQQIELADGSMLFPFPPNIVIQSEGEIVDYSFSNFASITCYSQIGQQVTMIADKYDLETDWKRYDRIFIPHRHYKTGMKIVSVFNIWIVGVSKDSDVCRLIFHVLD